MTSSLVGSEMCIRDSWTTTRLAIHALPPMHDACKRVPNFTLMQGAWPVSYTHLTLPTICSV
eukprot:8007185-Prorocentrum_lima.AAC.1